MRPGSERTIQNTVAVLHTEQFAQQHGSHPAEPPRVLPFITISRQGGAGGRTLANKLAQALNHRDPADVPWAVWDQELVERVAAEHRIPLARVQALEESTPNWLEEALGTLVVSAPATSEHTIYRRVAMTIRALCEMGRVIVVGRGGNFITASLPAGVHLRLVAPLERRIEWIAKTKNLTPEAAAKWVSEIESARAAFYRRYFRHKPLTPEAFTATYNTAATPVERLVESILALIPSSVATRQEHSAAHA
jgi:cytidylate kinase